MPYSDKVIDHFENPRNVGSFDKNDPNVGTGLVGKPTCGDVLKLQIKVNDGIIEDVCFKTFGCVYGKTPIACPGKYRKIEDLNIGDDVFAWNGKDIVINQIENIFINFVHYTNLIKIEFDGLSGYKFISTAEHVWWSKDQKPVTSDQLCIGDELFHITENELRIKNNIRHRKHFKEYLSQLMSITNKTKINHSDLPQNTKGYKHKPDFFKKLSLAARQNWSNQKYIKNWQDGVARSAKKRPTRLEDKFIDLFLKNNIDVRYTGDGKFWCSTKGIKNGINPDFKVNGQRKVIEVYDSDMPVFMCDRSLNSGWVENRRKLFERAGFKSLFIDIKDIDTAIDKVNQFIHNGLKIKNIIKITKKKQMNCINMNEDGMVMMYDLKLKDGANIYFAGRAASHNCGSAVSSSSLVTEWLKGKTLEEAQQIKNQDIAEELCLMPIKIHCSVLAADAIKAAIDDYLKKQEKHET